MNKKILVPFVCLFLTLSSHRLLIAQAQEQSENNSSEENAPEFGTVPGIYYDPDAGLSPSLSQLEGASESGFIEGDSIEGQEYNVHRAWAAGATPDEIVKVGDIENNPELEGFVSVTDSSVGEIVLEEGSDIESVPLQDIGLINNTSVNQFLEVLPQYENREASEFPIFRESFDNIDSINSDSNRELNEDQRDLVNRLANEPTLENISLNDAVGGDWGDSITPEEQATLATISEQYPELEQAPLNRLFPTSDQDWSSIVQASNQYVNDRGGNVTTAELLEAFPELGDVPLSALPVEDLAVSDLEGLSGTSLDEFSEIDDQYLADLGELSQNSDSILDENSSDIFSQGNIPGDVLARIDIPFAGEVETPIDYVLTGGTRNQIFSPEACYETSCKHFEVVDLFSGVAGLLTGLGEVQGKAWVQGSSQSVPGGKGALIVVNGGQERTGVSVWSPESHVKISLEDIDEGGNGEPSTARIWLDFQTCVYSGPVEHCTPHFLSFPTPYKIKAGGVMVVFSQTSPAELLEQSRNQSSPSGVQNQESQGN